MVGAPFTECVPPGRSGPHPESCQDPPRTRGGRTLRALNRRPGNRAHVDRRRLGQDRTADLARGSGKARGALITGWWRLTESDHAGKKAAHYLKRCAGPPGLYNCTMLQALRAQDALAIAEVSRRRSRDEQAMAQYLGIGRGARATGTPLDGTLLRRPDDVDLAAFESEERRRLKAATCSCRPMRDASS